MAKKKAARRGTPPRAKKRPSSTRALTRRVIQPAEILPAPAAPAVLEQRKLESGIHLGELGLVEIRFTPEEEAILSEPVPRDKVLMKPNGAPYLPHAEYTRWFNRAFGRGGWLLVPVGVPGLAQSTVICPYVLFIHGKPAALAQGEQDFIASNKNQSYGDALESTVASALRRCAKHLGVGLELWDRGWLDEWIEEFALRVQVKQKDDSYKTQWRRKQDRPLPFEKRGSHRPGSRDEYQFEDDDRPAPDSRRKQGLEDLGQVGYNAPPPPAAHHDANGDQAITKIQQQRLGVIIRNSGRDVDKVQKWVERKYHAKTSAEIKRKDYDAIVRAVEDDGNLPA